MVKTQRTQRTIDMEPWGRQKELEAEGHVPTQQSILNIANELKVPQEKILFLLTYLTAGRISEVIDISPADIESTFKEGREVILIHMPNRKHRKRHSKDIPIPMDKEMETLLIKPILDYAKTRPSRLFDFQTTQRARQILWKLGFNPHWLRHIRLTHLETIYGLSPERVKNFAGWTDTRPAKNYMELNWGDILDGM